MLQGENLALTCFYSTVNLTLNVRSLYVQFNFHGHDSLNLMGLPSKVRMNKDAYDSTKGRLT